LAVLSDADILKRLGKGGLRIEPFDEANLTPNGYDLSLAEIQPSGRAVARAGAVDIAPAEWFAVATRERVAFPSDLCGELWLRSSHIRKGIITSFGRVDAGFEGSLTMTGFNAGRTPVRLAVGDRYCQLVFVELSSRAAKPYAQRSGNYQGQEGITLEAFQGKRARGKPPRPPKKAKP
jgi:dCTP deaminase